MKSKVTLSAVLFLLTGAVSLFVENTYYQYVDENGFLQESMFLPIGVFSLIIGTILTFIIIANTFIKMLRQAYK